MKKSFFVLNFLFVFWSAQALSSGRCEQAYEAIESAQSAFLEFKMGIRQTGNENKPIGLQLVVSKHQILADAINSTITWALGSVVRFDVINRVMLKFLKDTSSDPYFVKMARAFDLKYETQEAILAKSIPTTGPTILTLNHPRNGSDGIAVAAAIEKIRPDVKVVMTHLLENIPGLGEHAIFLNPYSSIKAQRYNLQRLEEMKAHLRQGGLLVIFASGEVSMKDPSSNLKPIDPEWKNGVARLVNEFPEAQVVPVFVGGEATKDFYRIRQKGTGLRTTIFHIRELANNVSRSFPLSFSLPISATELKKRFGSNMKSMMQYLRARTYLMNEQTVLQKKTITAERALEPIDAARDPSETHQLIAQNSSVVFSDPKKGIQVYALDGARMPGAVWTELGIAREKSFRVVGEGSGKSKDVDRFDLHYTHIIAVDTVTNKILGAYRVGRVDKILAERGIEDVYTASFFKHEALLREKGSQMLELGRSFVDFEAGSKAILGLDRLWKGLASYIAQNPHYRYLIGSVSISNSYSDTSKLLMLKYLERNKDTIWAERVQGLAGVDYTSQFKNEIDLVAQQTTDLKELNQMVVNLDGISIPPLLVSYNKLGAKYLAFVRDNEFNTVDGLIVVDLASPEAATEANKFFGDSWPAYQQAHDQP